MVFQRCAWHTTYRGYPRYYGFTGDGRARITWTNGICPDCAARVRAEWRLVKRGAPAPRRLATLLRRGLATGALAATLLAAHSLDPAPLAPPTVRVSPSEALAVAVPTVAAPAEAPAVVVVAAPRRARVRPPAELAAQRGPWSLRGLVQLAHARPGRGVAAPSPSRSFDSGAQMP